MLTFRTKSAVLLLGASSLLSPFTSAAQSVDANKLKAQAVTIVKQFGGTLKPQLKKALKEGGVKHAIGVCSQQAPQIAKNLSLSTNWNVKRVSLKTRNHKNATPDSWENLVLKEFDQRQRQGEDAKAMVRAEVVNNEFRFMKAQGVAPLCLTCHGSDLSEEARSALKEHYPKDKATGYSLGEIRGAISLTKKL